jgi:hypothetical protein
MRFERDMSGIMKLKNPLGKQLLRLPFIRVSSGSGEGPVPYLRLVVLLANDPGVNHMNPFLTAMIGRSDAANGARGSDTDEVPHRKETQCSGCCQHATR